MKFDHERLLSKVCSYPVPFAHTFFRYKNAQDDSTRIRAIQDLAKLTLDLLNALAVSIVRSLMPAHDPVKFGWSVISDQLAWAHPEAVSRMWEHAALAVGTNAAPDQRKTEIFDFLFDILLVRPNNFIEALGTIADSANLMDHRGLNLRPPRSQREVQPDPQADWPHNYLWDSFLDLVFDKYLTFLKFWRFVSVEEIRIKGNEKQMMVTDLTGPNPLPACLSVPAVTGPQIAGHVYSIAPDSRWVDLNPFCLFYEPDMSLLSHTAPDSADVKGFLLGDMKRDLFILHSFGKNSAIYRCYDWNIQTPFNDLVDEIRRIFADVSIFRRQPWASPCWGYFFIELSNTSTLNQSLGYEVVDRLLYSMDQRGALLASENFEENGYPRLHPFWYKQDGILIPISYDEKLHPANELIELGQEVLRRLMLEATNALPPNARAYFNVMMDFQTILKKRWTRRDPEVHFMKEVETARLLVRSLRKKLGVQAEGRTLWLLRENEARGFFYRTEGIYTRVSEAVFGLISRKGSDGPEFLLRWNKGHGVFNFVGGHIEAQDCGDPTATLARELKEELGLRTGDYTFFPLFDDPLRSEEYSKRYRAWTYYIHYFFLTRLTSDRYIDLEGGEAKAEETFWATLEEIKCGKTTDGRPISSFPYRLLARVLPSILDVCEPLSAKTHTAEKWLGVPAS